MGENQVGHDWLKNHLTYGLVNNQLKHDLVKKKLSTHDFVKNQLTRNWKRISEYIN